ncbi:MAG TPA: ABC transporter permease [Anaerolineales bacterium]|jgi:ABC-2 type transport system permease protein|nr:ABC transporter permease [Anaerolineales bacterium]
MRQRLRSLIRKEFIQITRDPRTLGLIIIIPVMQLFLLGYAATNDVTDVPMAVYDLDQSSDSRALIEAYNSAGYFLVTHTISSLDELERLIEDGDVRVGLLIPPDYSNSLQTGQPAEIGVIIDGSDPSVAKTALSSTQLIGQAFGAQIQEQKLIRSGMTGFTTQPVEVRTQVWYNPTLEDAYFMVPGIVGMVLFTLTSMVTANSIVRERERGTIEQIIVTPIRPWELVVGKIVPYVILAFINTGEVLLIGSLWFHVPIRGSLWLVFGLSGVFLLTSLGIGLLASTIASTQQEAMLIVYMIFLPSVFLSGFFFPIAAMPQVLQWISAMIPLRYYLNIIRALLLKGVGITAIQEDVIALAIFGLALMTVASLRFRKRLD